MDLKELALHSTQLRHPWESSRARFFSYLTKRVVEPSRPLRALDIGSGDTWLARQLLAQLPGGSSMTCVDRLFTDTHISEFSSLDLRVRACREIPAGERFDLVFLLDVVEHIDKDRDFLTGLARDHVEAGGKLVISVPAYQALFSSHDEFLEHYRRYSPANGRALIKACGLELLDDGGLFHLLLYARIVSKAREMIRKPNRAVGVALWGAGALVTQVILRVLNFDWRLSEGFRILKISIPGLSWWCVCQKP